MGTAQAEAQGWEGLCRPRGPVPCTGLCARAGGRARVPPDPRPGPVCPGSGVEPLTANSSPTWKSTGLSRDCGSRTRTHTRPSAASCSSGPQRLAAGSEGSLAAVPPARLLCRHLSTPATSGPASAPPAPSSDPCVPVLASWCVCVRVRVCVCVCHRLVRPSLCFHALHLSLPLCPVSVPGPCV